MLALFAMGCSAEIGDSCSTNLDCSPNGDRICDTAQRGGYCTVEGCGPTTCSEEAVCVRFFPTAFLSEKCDPKTEDAVDPAVKATDDCLPDEACLISGLCAQVSLEQRFCMKRCDDNSDCRDDYECRPSGVAGAEAVPSRDDPKTSQARFCTQKN